MEAWHFPNLRLATLRTARRGRCGEIGLIAVPVADRVSGLTAGSASTVIQEWPVASELRSKKENVQEASVLTGVHTDPTDNVQFLAAEVSQLLTELASTVKKVMLVAKEASSR